MKSKSFGALKRLKSLYYVSAIAVPLLSGSAALAIAPTVLDYGAYYGSTEILKGDMSPLDKTIFQLKYNGRYQEFLELQNRYGNIATVYYKLGNNGTWSNKAPNLKSTGKHIIYYYVDGDPNYNDLGSSSTPQKITVNIVDWGKPVNNNGIINYVDSTGKTSAEVDKKGVIWVKEESEGKSSWYGLDNSSGIFETGSRFWVKLLDKQTDSDEYQKYFNQLDETHKQEAMQGKLWIFLTGVTKPDGTTEYRNLPIKVPCYIQLGDDWSENTVNALFIADSPGDHIESQINTASFFKSKYKGLNFADTSGKYMRLVLSSFSPFAIYSSLSSENSNTESADTHEYGSKGDQIKKSKASDVIYKNYNNHVNDVLDSENHLNPEIQDYPTQKDYTDNTEVYKDSVRFLIIEEIILTLLIGVIGYISKFIHKRKNEENTNNSSL